jgi:CheY-like chemotaxis protein
MLFNPNSDPNSDPKIDIIFMDLDMPIIGGLEATKIIRQMEKS